MKISCFKLFLVAVLLMIQLPASSAEAQTLFIGEIIEVGYTFCPRGTTDANGQLLDIASNTALFSLYGTIYGGDGRTTFALPDLRGRRAIGAGTGNGLSTYRQGEVGGLETVTLSANEVPAHSHAISELTNPQGSTPGLIIRNGGGETTEDTGLTGSSLDHDNVPPFQVIRYCVVLEGVFPSRN